MVVWLRKIGALFLGIAALSACASSNVPLAQANAPGYNAPEIYVLGSGDRIKITVYEEPDLSGDFIIDDRGQLSMPVIDEVNAAGLTIAEVRTLVREAFSRTLLVNPKVSAEISEYKPYFIFGEIASPGRYPSYPDLSVYNAIASAGGLTYRANRKFVFIKHADREDELKYELKPGLAVLPGDTIRVGERFF